MTLSKSFYIFFISFILGIFFASLFSISLIFLFIFIIFSFFLIFILYKYKKLLFLGIIIIFFIVGFLRFNLTKEELNIGEEIIIEGIINSEPKETEKVKIFRINNILIITEKYSDYNYGDKLKIEGNLGENFSLFFPKIEKISSGGNGFYNTMLSLKNNLREKINKNFSYQEGSILKAMILGDKDKMGNELKEKLNISGTRHITAISGMHIVLITSFLMIFLLSIGVSKSLSFYLSVIFLFFYILMIGFPPSAIRAGIMGLVYNFSQKSGKMNNSSRNIFFTAGIMLFLNPLLIYDYGFNLSFLAVFGIIHFFPILEKYLTIFKKRKTTRSLLFITISAYIFTFPYLIYNFNQVSLVAIFSNLLVIPLVYSIMIFGLLFLFSSLIFNPLSYLFIIPLWVLLSSFLFIINIFSKFPYLKINNIHIIFPLLSYFFLFYVLYFFNKKIKYDKI